MFAAAFLAMLAIWPVPGHRAAMWRQAETTVTLNESFGPPDTSVVIPVDLTAPDGVRVGEIEIELVVPSTLVVFEKAALSGGSEAAGAEIAVARKAGQQPDTSKLRVIISGRVEGTSRTPLPTGQLAHLIFQILKTTEPGSEIVLAPKVAARTAASPPVTIDAIDAPQSRIVVSSPAVIACFFYMH